MLRKLTRKLCPILSLAMTFGCGKQIAESENAKIVASIEEDFPRTVFLELLGNQGPTLTYHLPRTASFKLPGRIFVQKGNAIGKRVRITYNQEPDNPEDYEFECYYRSTYQPDELPLEKCLYLDSDMGDVTNHEYTMDQGKVIHVEVLNSSPLGLELHLFYSVQKWL